MPGTIEGSLPAALVDDVISKMGDAKAQRLSAEMVLAYTQPRLIVIDKQRVQEMFAEADYKHAGTVSRAALIAAATGRYPKRHYGQQQWLEVLATAARWPLMRIDEYLASQDSSPGRPNQASPTSSPKRHMPAKCVRLPSGEWATFASSPVPGSPSASQQHPLQSLLGGQADTDADDGGILITTGGIKSTKQIEAEEAVNQQLLREGKVGFEARKHFQQFAHGLEMTSTLTAELGLRSAGNRSR